MKRDTYLFPMIFSMCVLIACTPNIYFLLKQDGGFSLLVMIPIVAIASYHCIKNLVKHFKTISE